MLNALSPDRFFLLIVSGLRFTVAVASLLAVEKTNAPPAKFA